MAQDNLFLILWIAIPAIVLLVIIAAIMSCLFQRRAKQREKQKQRRKESAIILENFQSIEDLVWSYSRNTRDKLFQDSSVESRPWSHVKCHGPIFDGISEQSNVTLARPWVIGQKDNPIFDDTSSRGTLQAPPHPIGGRPWVHASQSYNIDFTDSIQRELSEWKKDIGVTDLDGNLRNWSRANYIRIEDEDKLPSQMERHVSECEMNDWNKNDNNINHWAGINQIFIESDREPSIRSSYTLGFGDSLHRELYRWANMGQTKGIKLFSVQQKEDANKNQILKDTRAISPFESNSQVQSHHSNYCDEIKEESRRLHESSTSVQRGNTDSTEKETRKHVKQDNGFSSAQSSFYGNDSHRNEDKPSNNSNVAPSKPNSLAPGTTNYTEVETLSEQSHNQELKPIMNKKRISLVEMLIRRQKKSGSGEFYTRNKKMFENYKRHVRDGGAPEVLYFHY